MDVARRTMLGIGAAALGETVLAANAAAAIAAAGAEPHDVPAPPEPRGLLSSEIVELWPEHRVPGASGVTVTRAVVERGRPDAHDRAVMHVTRPMLEVFRPARPNGAAVILMPGGGYVRLAVDKEGAMGARWLASIGVTAFVLNYRLPGDGWAAGLDAPLQDAQRSVRLVRAMAGRWGVDPRRIGILGFSAGGHLAGALLTRFDSSVYAEVDDRDRGSARPDFVGLGYAVMSPGLRDIAPGPESARPLDRNVRPGLPPTFILHAADDPTVPVSNSLAMFQALKAARVPTELHIYQEAGHGFGFALPSDRPAAAWPAAFAAWAGRDGFFART